MQKLADYEKTLIAQRVDRMEPNCYIVAVSPKVLALVGEEGTTFLVAVHDKRVPELAHFMKEAAVPEIASDVTLKLEEIIVGVLGKGGRPREVVCALASSVAFSESSISKSPEQLAGVLLGMFERGEVTFSEGNYELPEPATG